MSPEALAEKILERLKGGPLHFEDILLQFREEPYRVVLQAWGRLREARCSRARARDRTLRRR